MLLLNFVVFSGIVPTHNFVQSLAAPNGVMLQRNILEQVPESTASHYTLGREVLTTSTQDQQEDFISELKPKNISVKKEVFHESDQVTIADNATVANATTMKPDIKSKYTSRKLACKNGEERRLPTTIIIGSRKAGTRAVLEYIALHPDVVVAGREILFFTNHYSKGLDFYRDEMPCSKPNEMTIEKTPAYILSDETPERIYAMNKDIKLVLVVRDPVQRTISDYVQFKVRDRISQVNNRSIEEVAFLPNSMEPDVNFDAVKWSIYYKYFSNYLQYFSMDQMHILDGDVLTANPYKEINKLETFLGLENKIKERDFYWNETKGFYCYKKPSGINHCFANEKGRPHPDVHPDYLREMYRFFEPLNEKFFTQIGQRFDWAYPSSNVENKQQDMQNKTEHSYQNLTDHLGTTDACPVGSEQKFPSVMIIGSNNKSTEMAAELMNLHPTITSVKYELDFFNDNFNYSNGVDNYLSHMPCTPFYGMTLDWSSKYLFNKEVPERLNGVNFYVQVVVILEDPVKRIISQYEEFIQRYKQTNDPTILDQIRAYPGTEHEALDHSMYYKHLLEWYIWFRNKQIKVLSHESFMKNPLKEIEKIEQFVKIGTIVSDDTQYQNIISDEKYSEKNTYATLVQEKKRKVYVHGIVKVLYNYYQRWNNLLNSLIHNDFEWSFDSFI